MKTSDLEDNEEAQRRATEIARLFISLGVVKAQEALPDSYDPALPPGRILCVWAGRDADNLKEAIEHLQTAYGILNHLSGGARG